MKRLLLILIVLKLIIISIPAEAESTLTFKQSLPVIKQALRNQNFKILDQQIALNGIVGSKIKKVIGKPKTKSSTGRKTLAGLLLKSEPLLTKLATNFIRQNYSKSSQAERNMYVATLIIKKVFEKPERGTAHGSFMGKPASFYAKKIKGKWVIVGVDSVIIDQEIDNLLKILLNRDTP